MVLFTDALCSCDLPVWFLLCCMHCTSPATIIITAEHLCSISVQISVQLQFFSLFFLLFPPQHPDSFRYTSLDALLNTFVKTVWIRWPPAASFARITGGQLSKGMILYPPVFEVILANVLKGNYIQWLLTVLRKQKWIIWYKWIRLGAILCSISEESSHKSVRSHIACIIEEELISRSYQWIEGGWVYLDGEEGSYQSEFSTGDTRKHVKTMIKH